MVDVSRYAPGEFCWPELATTDAEGAKLFYGGLFGWKPVDVPAGPDMTYTMLSLGGRDAGALYQQGPKEKGVPPHWNTYIAVESADAAAARAKELGGKALMEPFDVMDVGRMAVLSGPDGACFCVWQAGKHHGAQVRNENGAFGWHELQTRTMKASNEFYAALFPTWRVEPSKNAGGFYSEIWIGERPIGGIMDASTHPPEWPSFWNIYFEVASCDAVVEKAVGTGGKAIVGPRDFPNVGRFAVLQDPQGAVFSVIQLATPHS
jgi:hypothetical protein